MKPTRIRRPEKPEYEKPTVATFDKKNLPLHFALHLDAVREGGYKPSRLADALGIGPSAITHHIKKEGTPKTLNPKDRRSFRLPVSFGDKLLGRRFGLRHLGKDDVVKDSFLRKHDAVSLTRSAITNVMNKINWHTVTHPQSGVVSALPRTDPQLAMADFIIGIARQVKKNYLIAKPASRIIGVSDATVTSRARALGFEQIEIGKKESTLSQELEEARRINLKKPQLVKIGRTFFVRREDLDALRNRVRRKNPRRHAGMRLVDALKKIGQRKGAAERIARRARLEREMRGGKAEPTGQPQPKPAPKPKIDERGIAEPLLQKNPSLKRDVAFGFVRLLAGAGVEESKIREFARRFPDRVGELCNDWGSERKDGAWDEEAWRQLIRRRVNLFLRWR